MRIFISILVFGLSAFAGELTQKLEAYREELTDFHAEYSSRELPYVRFYRGVE